MTDTKRYSIYGTGASGDAWIEYVNCTSLTTNQDGITTFIDSKGVAIHRTSETVILEVPTMEEQVEMKKARKKRGCKE